ncbi:MAG: choice-of-anchor Q domain-containing protein [Bacteroidales bacterium]|nr:choice-of-anchor Q domain-containing protein [Bacteroidales bacterium]
MKTSLYLFIFALTITKAPCQMITVALDGSGHFQSIQEAIDASQDNDTILVYPGTYFENLNLLGKDLVIGSLNLTTGDPTYIHQTIIDGNYNGACIAIRNMETAHIQGFTIQHGSGWVDGLGRTRGGGVNIYNQCDVSIINCSIINNICDMSGGGIHNVGSRLFLSGTLIKKNFAKWRAGGLSSSHLQNQNAILEFDSINLCSVYLNHAPVGADMFYQNDQVQEGFILDTFSVSIPTRYQVFQQIGDDDANDSIRLVANAYIINSLDADLYVNAIIGDNSNSGLSKDEPLKSLTWAMHKVNNMTGKDLTIYLSPGVYSPESNGELFPMSIRSRISIVGSGSENTFLDAENQNMHILTMYYQKNCKISNLSFVNGNGNAGLLFGTGSGYYYANKNIVFDSVSFKDNKGYQRIVSFITCDSVMIKNSKIVHNYGGKALRVGAAYNIGSLDKIEKVYVTNTLISNNLPWYDSIIPYGGSFGVSSTSLLKNPLRVDLIGCEITENTTDMNGGFTGCNNVYNNAEAYFINTTIGTNTMINPNTNPILYIGEKSKVALLNSIFYGNSPSSIMLYGDGVTPSELSISYSLIEGGSGTITGDLIGNNLFYDDSNIDTDPLFTGYGDFPYSLSGLSPCIDAGTLELPEGITLPTTDLAGNPRVWGGSVDMGAYEFNPISIGESRLQAKAPARIVASSNPFVHELGLTVTPKTGVPVCITVHNLLGREVARLLDQTDNRLAYTTLQWNGRGSAGENLPAGAYIISLVENGKEVESLRVVKSER